MKKLFLLYLFTSLAYACFSQFPAPLYHNTLENSRKDIFNNKIKNEYVYSYTFTKKRIKDSILIGSLSFDLFGHIIRSTLHNSYKDDTTMINYQYNTDNSIHRMLIDYPYPGSITEIIEYAYDSVGNNVMTYTYNPDTTYVHTKKMIYNEGHQLISSYERSGDDDFQLKERWYYSEDGRFAKEETYNAKGIIEKSYITELDTSARKKTYYNEDKKGKHFMGDALYDSAGRYIRTSGKTIERYYGRSFPGRVAPIEIDHPRTQEYTYNADGILFECVLLMDDRKMEIIRHYYSKE